MVCQIALENKVASSREMLATELSSCLCAAYVKTMVESGEYLPSL